MKSIPNTFCMPHKCIYSHTYEVFVMQSCIQAYKGNTNIYGPLWTQPIYALYEQNLLSIFMFFLLIFPSKDILIPYTINNCMTDFFHHHSIMYVFTPPIFSCLLHILLLFLRTISPQFTCIIQVDTALYLTLIWVLYSLMSELVLQGQWHVI